MNDYDKIRMLGAIPSKQDRRDFHVSRLLPYMRETFPAEYRIPQQTPIYDQDIYGMCVAFSLKTAKEVHEIRERRKHEQYSAAYIYARRDSGDYHGEGMEPRDALKCLQKRGVCKHETFPNLGNYTMLSRMLKAEWDSEAEPQKITAYAQCYTVDDVKAALMGLGPVLLCIAVYDSFYKGGYLKNPDTSAEQIRGYHAMVITGWTKDGYWVVQNSWGKRWGDNGLCYMPLGYKPIIEMWTMTDYQPEPLPEPQKEEYDVFLSPWGKTGVDGLWRVQLSAFKNKQDAKIWLASTLEKDLARLGKGIKVVNP
jgi:C1A family cysteine protease